MSAPLFADPTVLPEPGPFADPTVLGQPDPALPAHEDHHLRLALELAAAFLVCAQLARNYLADREPGQTSRQVAEKAWKHVMPTWLSLAGNAIRESMLASGSLPEVDTAVLTKAALDYAGGVGDYLGMSTVDAFSQGVEAQLADRWSDMAAYTRAAAGFGLDRAAMVAFLKAASSGAAELVSPAARGQADTALVTRATLIGDTEAATSHETIRLLMWQHMVSIGQLPDTVQREWRTAVREDKCPICGPLDRARAALDEPFVVGDVELWAPQAHPNCRCRVELVAEVAKAYDVRNPKGSGREAGRFTKKPLPVVNRPVMERVQTSNPTVDAMIAAAADQAAETAAPTEAPTDTAFTAPVETAFSAPVESAFSTATESAFAAPAEGAFSAPPESAFSDGGAFGDGGAFTFSVDDPATLAAFLQVPGTRYVPPIPTFNIVGRDTTFIARPELRHPGNAYYLPAQKFLDSWPKSQNTMLALGSSVNFGPYRTTLPDAAPNIARVADDPWDGLTDSALRHERLVGRWEVINEEPTFVPALTDHELHSLWDVMWPDLEDGWSHAVKHASHGDNDSPNRGIVSRLTDQDVVNIAAMADDQTATSIPDLKDKIRAACAPEYDTDPDLRAAYGDYVVYHRPDLLGSLGDVISTHLGVARSSFVTLDRPVDQVMLFKPGRPGLHPGTRVNGNEAEPTKNYRVSHISYHSALEEEIRRPLAMGLQVLTMEPYVRRIGLL